MNSFITDIKRFLIKKLIVLSMLSLCLSAQAMLFKHNGKKEIHLPSKDVIYVSLAITHKEQAKGLSGIKYNQFPKNHALLFVSPVETVRQFWMPDTYMNLDIFFIDRRMKVIGVERNVPAHPGMKEPPPIYRTKRYKCQYVLEMRADSKLSKKIKKGDTLTLK